jgi:hypothetical protein
LDSDFFAQAQRLSATQLSKRDRDLFAFIREEFGQLSYPTLEVFFTQVTAVDRFHHEFNIRGRPSGRFSRHLTALRALIPRVFGEALGGLNCVWHERIANALRAGDAIISFNYDTLMDRALRTAGGKRWDSERGYGFQVDSGSSAWNPPPGPGPRVASPVLLLKPHGSLNWSIEDDGSIRLVEEYAPETAESIVPPTWDKSDVSLWPWSEVWRSARAVLGQARVVVVIGYSVPVTDQLSQALLRADVNRLEALVVVNPDVEARRRMIQVMSSALSTTATVIELATIQEFAAYLAASPAEDAQPDIWSELVTLKDGVARVRSRIASVARSHDTLERQVESMQSTLDDISEHIDELVDNDTIDEVQRIQRDLEDLDSRVDSLAQS